MIKRKVLIVDDSVFVRQALAKIINEDPELEVIGSAMDPVFAFQKIIREEPDVITLDVEMPRMNGLTFLEKLMKSYQIPVVMISSYTQKGCETTLKALELGAVDFIAKPQSNHYVNFTELSQEIKNKVKNAANANLRYLKKSCAAEQKVHVVKPNGDRKYHICVVGASTGGVTAIKTLINQLKPAQYSILVTLHMPAGFTRSFAERLNFNGWSPCEAQDGQLVMPGYIYVAPGGQNMLVEKINGELFIRICPCEREDIFKPNVNKTFSSVARHVGPEAIGVILTGMGDDGAAGLLQMKESGAVTFAQSEESCMVFGMPKKAIESGAVDFVLPLEHMGVKVQAFIEGDRD